MSVVRHGEVVKSVGRFVGSLHVDLSGSGFAAACGALWPLVGLSKTAIEGAIRRDELVAQDQEATCRLPDVRPGSGRSKVS
jgi:hypothetical protein